MKEIIFGTGNPAKLAQVQGVLKPLGITVLSIKDFGEMPEVDEDGETALENARKKALAYAKATGKVVFSMDNALYIDGLGKEEQPGTNVRRAKVIDHRLSDAEMQEYYPQLIARIGGKTTGHFEYGVAIAGPSGIIEQATIKAPDRIFTSTISAKSVPGYPLESIQIDPETNRYVAELSEEEQASYWQRTIGVELQKLFKGLR